MSKSVLKLLIVDDDLVDGECLLRYVKKRGLECEASLLSDGGAALEFMRKDFAENRRDRTIVVLDINMPGINGHEFLEELRNDPGLQPTIVFVFTSSSHERDISQAYGRNVAGFFNKSNMQGLLDTIVAYAESAEFPVLHSD